MPVWIASLRAALVAALFLGAVSTLGDFVWATWIPRHRPVYGLIHGAALCACLGLAIGVRQGRPVAGALVGPIIGLIAAGGYYLLAPLMRFWAMFPMWMLFWVLFGITDARLRGDRRPGPALARGLAAAVVSGAAFYAIAGIWLRPPPGGPNYAYHFAAWTFAFLPGFAALLVRGYRA